MLDCNNIDIREQLPDLLHGRLDATRVALVEQHLSACAECRAELDVLRSARAVLTATPTPRIDHQAILAAVARTHVTPEARPVRWRWAAAITLVILGGTSVATAVRSFRNDPTSDSTQVPAIVASIDTPTAVPTSTPTVVPTVGEPSAVRLTAGGGIDDLADEDLEALIGALEKIEVAPHAEPEGSRQSRWISSSTGGN
ncbi:MAG: zf-HC2 domain-containing protein [Gemmatimonadetes bacterium]|nr:zf-HC2 domain-containing protein [Gemmatimonadota bacterium]